jgi:hypothetical protein
MHIRTMLTERHGVNVCMPQCNAYVTTVLCANGLICVRKLRGREYDSGTSCTDVDAVYIRTDEKYYCKYTAPVCLHTIRIPRYMYLHVHTYTYVFMYIAVDYRGKYPAVQIVPGHLGRLTTDGYMALTRVIIKFIMGQL